jgi:hypothetical protein
MGLDTTLGRRPVTEALEETMRRTLPILALATLFASAPLFAQQTQPTTQPATQPKEGSVNDRRQDQQGRIANGVQSGQLTAGETKNLESREANVNREIKNDRMANGGKLTPQERQQVNRQQNNMSKSIYNDKHNANAAHYGNNEVGQRRENQQDRIAQGIKSGQMTAGEAARTENREQGINRQVRADRQANGGKLTGQERRQVNREQNRTSRQIYRQKHNTRVAPK